MDSGDGEETVAGRKAARDRSIKRLWLKARDGLGAVFYLVASALIVMAGWAAYANAAISGWDSNAAAWVQAAGSIAAIAGAAWLAQSESRRARRLRREQNEEAAWYVRFAVVQAQLESHIIADGLVNRSVPIETSDVREWRQRATTCAVGLNALADRTDHIHPAVTHVISNAKVLVDDLVSDLVRLSELVKDGKKPDGELVGLIVGPHRALQDLVALYDERMHGVHLALDEGGDALPIRTWSRGTQVRTN
ncbi:hypothetical protein [Mesorhizobium sp. LCM 4577]|uniref:hypothetical protein n=1 Tax=Mesorhizobium sp. LCM 4577 TaxID=1848288 RepID=UPI0008D905E9|nr:hypothetical protein [Mesorhizobium sp. LCM 4577]